MRLRYRCLCYAVLVYHLYARSFTFTLFTTRLVAVGLVYAQFCIRLRFRSLRAFAALGYQFAHARRVAPRSVATTARYTVTRSVRLRCRGYTQFTTTVLRCHTFTPAHYLFILPFTFRTAGSRYQFLSLPAPLPHAVLPVCAVGCTGLVLTTFTVLRGLPDAVPILPVYTPPLRYVLRLHTRSTHPAVAARFTTHYTAFLPHTHRRFWLVRTYTAYRSVYGLTPIHFPFSSFTPLHTLHFCYLTFAVHDTRRVRLVTRFAARFARTRLRTHVCGWIRDLHCHGSAWFRAVTCLTFTTRYRLLYHRATFCVYAVTGSAGYLPVTFGSPLPVVALYRSRTLLPGCGCCRRFAHVTYTILRLLPWLIYWFLPYAFTGSLVYRSRYGYVCRSAVRYCTAHAVVRIFVAFSSRLLPAVWFVYVRSAHFTVAAIRSHLPPLRFGFCHIAVIYHAQLPYHCARAFTRAAVLRFTRILDYAF